MNYRVSSKPFVRIDYLILSVFFLGVAIRLSFAITSDFPINDGGLFYIMIKDLQNNNFSLPLYTTYNNAGIPYVYPPFAFYVAGLLEQVTPFSLFDILLFLPATITTLTIPAFYILSRDLLSKRTEVVISLFAFILIPDSFRWLIMGGGLTRSFGLLFSLLALHHVFRLYCDNDPRRIPIAALFCGLTVLSHPANTYFLIYSIALFFLVLRRTKTGVYYSLFLLIGTMIFTIPWIFTVTSRHGLALLMPGVDNGFTFVASISRLLLLKITNELFIPIWTFAFLFGFIIELINKKYFLPLWVIVIFILHTRAADQVAVIPLAILAGIGGYKALRTMFIKQLSGWWYKSMRLLIIGFILLYSIVIIFVAPPQLMTPLPQSERDAMRWIDMNTPITSRILVISPTIWYLDRSSEWLPALASRHNVSVVQGYEWMGDFSQRIEQHIALQECSSQAPDCIEKWIVSTGRLITHLYIPKPCIESFDISIDKCGALRSALKDDPHYSLIYDEAGATIFQYVK